MKALGDTFPLDIYKAVDDLVGDDSLSVSSDFDKENDFPEIGLNNIDLMLIDDLEEPNKNKTHLLEFNSNFNLIYSNWAPVYNYRDQNQSSNSSPNYYTGEFPFSENTITRSDIRLPSREDSTLAIISPQSVFVPHGSRFFVIKSFNESDVRSSFLHKVWSSTNLGNKRLNRAFKNKQSNERIFLFFSVNGSGKFCGVAEMISELDNEQQQTDENSIWLDQRWKGKFNVQWIFVKDILNSKVRHLKVPMNDWKPVTNSRDTQELPFEIGMEMIQLFKNVRSNASFLQNMSL